MASSRGQAPFRILPQVTDRNRAFWTGGRDGELRILRCRTDGTYIHPPTPVCPRCHGKDLAPEAVSGRATVHTFTVNHQPWMPGPELPYVVAIVALAEDPTVRLTTNVVGTAPEDVHIGQAVRVVFERHDDETLDDERAVWLPLFEPDPDGHA